MSAPLLTIFVLVNLHYQHPDWDMTAYPTRELCMEQMKKYQENVVNEGSSARSHAMGLECIPYQLKRGFHSMWDK